VKHTIEITIQPGGIIESKVHGIVGNGCINECNWLSKLGKIEERKLTEDAMKKEYQQIKRTVSS
jgi:hypothetical protein